MFENNIGGINENQGTVVNRKCPRGGSAANRFLRPNDGGAPFDAISDFYRGMRGSMTDMYRCPDKLLAACEKILAWRIKRATPADPKVRGNPKRIFIALHRGAKGFMSKKSLRLTTGRA